MLSIHRLPRTVAYHVKSFFIRRNMTTMEFQDIQAITKTTIGKVLEPKGSIFFKANHHLNVKTASYNTTATHSLVVIENGLTIRPTFLSLTDFEEKARKQFEIIRYTVLNTRNLTHFEITQMSYSRVQRWCFLSQLREEKSQEHAKLEAAIKKDIAENSHWTQKQILENTEYLTDICLYGHYHDEGFQIPSNSKSLELLYMYDFS